MSVTFQIEALPTGQYNFTCYADFTLPPQVSKAYDSHEEALAASKAHSQACQECSDGYWASAIYDVNEEMNVSNGNAVLVLSEIGLWDPASQDLCGSMDADDFLGRVLVALARERDGRAVPARELPRPMNGSGRGPRVIMGGRPENYVHDRLTRLAEIATEAKRLGRCVVWG